MTIEQALLHRPVLVVAAHPDDETVSAGGILPDLRDVVIVHLTRGAPRNLADSRAAGFQVSEEYGAARWRELLTAMKLAGIRESQLHPLDAVDQEASFDMAYLALKLEHLLRELRPGGVLTHPYEGGHPDHDAAAFAVHAACARVAVPPDIYEFTSYHAAAQARAAGSAGPVDAPVRIETGRFLPGTDGGEAIVLDGAARARKQAMIECFPTQLHMLRQFPLDLERYRPSPVYDFSEAPHAGRLHYEYFDWGVTGETWRRLAAQALRTLGTGTIL